MSNDDLLRALGRVAAEQTAEQANQRLPAELAAAPSPALRQRLAEQALAALTSPGQAAERGGPTVRCAGSTG